VREKADADEAEAARSRTEEAELRQLQERTAQARARRDAALATTARLEAEAARAAAEADRARHERARQQATRDAEEAERAAARAEAAATRAATESVKPNGMTRSTRGTDAPARPTHDRVTDRREPAQAPSVADAELTPLAMLFREQLGGLVGEASDDHPPAVRDGVARVAPREPGTPSAVTSSTTPRRAHPSPHSPQPAIAARTPVAPSVAGPPSAPPDELPVLTGADLASYRSWLGVSQRALATKLGVEQSSVSRGEGKPTTVLPASLRQALHLAMSEPRPEPAAMP
jgi:hypothetical protein